MVKNNKEFIIQEYKKVKALGWVKSNRRNNTGIGKTFEDYIGVVENNLEEPDLAGFEIKSHRAEASNYVTLFTKVPNFPNKANVHLNYNFGIPYEENLHLKKLHTSMFATKYNTYGNKYSFRLINDRKSRKLKIGVFDINTHELIDAEAGYTYECLSTVLQKKLKNLFFVSAQRRYCGKNEEFYFNHAEIYTEPSFDKFIDLIDKGLIMYDIRIGCYQSGANYGKSHDHGSGFRILERDIHRLYSNKEIVD